MLCLSIPTPGLSEVYYILGSNFGSSMSCIVYVSVMHQLTTIVKVLRLENILFCAERTTVVAYVCKMLSIGVSVFHRSSEWTVVL